MDNSLHQITEELSESKAKFLALSETMEYNSFVVVLWNLDDLSVNYISANAGYLGILPGALTDMNSWAALVHPDDLDSFWAQRKPMLGQSVNVDFWHEYRVINKNGEVRWIHERISYIPVSGSKLYRSVMIDTTARHEHNNIETHAKMTGSVKMGNIHLLDIVSAGFLQELCDSVSNSLGFPSYILDPLETPLTEIKDLCELCGLIRSTEKGSKLCNLSRSNMCIAARDKGGKVIAACETIGLFNAAVPITVCGKHMGTWIAGRIHINNSISEDNIRALSKKLSIDENAAIKAFRSIAAQNSEDIPKVFSILNPYVQELTDYIHRSYLLMHEAERMIKSQEFISKSLKIDNLQNHIYETFFRPRADMNGMSCYHDALEAISNYFGFSRAIIIRPRGRRLEPFFQWHEPELPSLPLELLEQRSLNALYHLCPKDSSIKHIGSDEFPWKSLDHLGPKDCYVYSAEHNGKCAGIVCLMQDENRPILSQDELNSLSFILSALGSYMITKRLEQRMLETSESLHMVLNNLKDTVYVIDQETYEVVFANANFDGKSIVHPRGVACFRLLGQDTTCACCGLDMIRDHPNGASYSFETGERVAGLWHSITMTSMEWLGERSVFLISVRDITEEKLRHQEFIEAATFDLTLNIPNIGRLTTRLDKLLSGGRAHGFLFIIDINNFQLISNAYGHDYSDALLEEIKVFLKSYMPRGEYVYRYATKTFAVLYEDADEEKAKKLVDALYGRFNHLWNIKDKICYATFSTAMIHYDKNDKNAAKVMRNAAIALDKAIDRNRNSFYALDKNIDDNYTERVELVNDLHAMIESGYNGFLAHYQPVYDINSDKILYVEALMRWNHPERGFIPPLKFIEAAEGASLIAPLSEKLMDMAIAQCKQWQKTLPDLKLCVNFSVVHSYQEGVLERISQLFKKHDFSPQHLIAEINERDTVSDFASLFAFMRSLQELGCGVAIDDFGSGMSSLGKLQTTPVDYIKIDRCFVKNICDSAYDRAVVKFMANLPLDVKMVCEGIETQEQLDMIKSLGISICQGYFLSRPLPPEDIVFL